MVEQASRRDVTTPLLERITEESLDQDYRLAASRRAEDGSKRPRLGRPTLLVLAAFGLLVGTAGAQATLSAQDDRGERSSLLGQIESRRDRVSSQQQTLTDLRSDARILEAELATITQAIGSAEGTIERLDLSAGLSRVTGPGLRIVVDDPPGADDNELVRADDLGLLLDGLWNAGAEAIAVDGQRITAVTALRNSGTSIGVNRVPLRAPYSIRVIGNSRTLEANLLDTTSGLAWQALVDQLGFRVEVDNVDEMTLPPGRLRTLAVAQGTQQTDQAKVQEIRP